MDQKCLFFSYPKADRLCLPYKQGPVEKSRGSHYGFDSYQFLKIVNKSIRKADGV